MSEVKLYHGDCLDVMAELEENSIDSIVTDPPGGISFMGKLWDNLSRGRSVGSRRG
jgi:site-specific DNA-methyltransferase (adenine-specific)